MPESPLTTEVSLPASLLAADRRVRRVQFVVVRLTEFRSLMVEHFGPTRAPSVSHDHVFGALGNRTADEAISAGLDVRTIWFAVCDSFDVPDTLRWGLPD